jgi:hypothetical protein
VGCGLVLLGFLLFFCLTYTSNPFSIDDDILNLMDEVDIEAFLREASEAIEDSEKLARFIRDKSTTAVERFLVC